MKTMTDIERLTTAVQSPEQVKEIQQKQRFWNLQENNKELAGLVDVVYHSFKWPKNPATPMEWRLAAIIPVLSYCQVVTAEVRCINGIWMVGTMKNEAKRRDEVLAELKAIKKGDEDITKGQIADVLDRYHRRSKFLGLF